MSTIVTRSGKGSPLTHAEVDDNFTNLNTDKYQEGSAIGAVTPAAGTFTTLTASALTATGQTSLGGPVDAEGLKVTTLGTVGSNNYVSIEGSAGSGTPVVGAWGTGSNVGFSFRTRGNGAYSFATGSSVANRQFNVSHTASAVNYVQVTGAATGSNPTISTQGSDTNAGLNVQSKGTGVIRFLTGNGTENFRVNAVSTTVNYLAASGAIAGAAPSFAAQGSDTNIDLTLTPKGSGMVRFGTRTASADAAITGYIEIKDSGGTTRRLAVIG